MPGMVSTAAITAARNAKENKDGRKVETNPIRAQSIASYAADAIQDDDGSHDWYECWFMCRYQIYVRRWYASDFIQVSVAIFIFLNFIVEASAAQLIGAGDPYASETFFMVMEWFFTILFTIELGINMFAHWWWRFWEDGWNWFDFIVVAVSLLAVMGGDLPGIAVLRLLRAFRVFRLFKRLENLRKIVKALEESIPGVANAFMILILVMGIYGILGVEFFRNSFVHPVFGTEHNYFENFGASMFSLFQVMTGESWSEMIARPCIRKDGVLGSFYFVSYVLVTMFVLVNVVIAVLLEKLMGDVMSTETDDTYDVFEWGKEWMRRTDPKNSQMEDAILGLSSKAQLDKDSSIVENKCVYVHVYPVGKWKKVKSDIEGKNVLIVPRPDPDDPDPDAERYDDDGFLIEEEKYVKDAVEEFQNRMCCGVLKVTRVEHDDGTPFNAGKTGYDLIRIQLDNIPLVLEAREFYEWKTGDRPNADGPVKKCKGDPATRRPRKRDIIKQYQIPPEPMAGLIKRIDDSLSEYVDLLAWRVQCVNAHLDNLHESGAAKRKEDGFEVPDAAVYAGPDKPGDNTEIPNIIPSAEPKPDEDKKNDPEVEVITSGMNGDDYSPEPEGGTKTDGSKDDKAPDAGNQPSALPDGTPAVL